jgi:hypothetical protein
VFQGPARWQWQQQLLNPVPLAWCHVKDKQRVFACHPSINAKIDWLKGVIAPVADQFVNLDQSYLSIWSVCGEIENRANPWICLDVLPGVPTRHGVSVELRSLHV